MKVLQFTRYFLANIKKLKCNFILQKHLKNFPRKDIIKIALRAKRVRDILVNIFVKNINYHNLKQLFERKRVRDILRDCKKLFSQREASENLGITQIFSRNRLAFLQPLRKKQTENNGGKKWLQETKIYGYY